MADVLNFNVNRAFDINGDPAPGAMAYFYDAGTSTPQAVFADVEGTIQHPVPLIADSQGLFPPVYTAGGSGVAVEVTDEDGVMLDGYPMPVAVSVPAEGANASTIAFNPTAQIPQTTVQGAIEQVQENLVAPLAAFGLGVTGNAPLLTNINALDIASGMYRYEAGTLGSFPPGVTAGTGGAVTVWRRNNGSAIMMLFPVNADGFYVRRMLTLSWQAWRKYVTFEEVKANNSASNFGINQTVQDFTTRREGGQVYQNTTGKPIGVWIFPKGEGLGDYQIAPNRTDWMTMGNSVQNGRNYQFMLVPDQWFYRATGTGEAESWKELR